MIYNAYSGEVGLPLAPPQADGALRKHIKMKLVFMLLAENKMIWR